MSTCLIAGCEKPPEKRGWCQMHYRRWQRHGDPEKIGKRPNGSGCIYLTREGYLTIQFGKACRKLHVLLGEYKIGRPLKSNEVVHHKNGDRADNRLENLEVMDRGKHIGLHHKGIPDNPDNTKDVKRCPVCKEIKPRVEFTRGDDAFGSRSHCRACISAYDRTRHMEAKHP